jgi:uncharacterized OB-fold protein
MDVCYLVTLQSNITSPVAKCRRQREIIADHRLTIPLSPAPTDPTHPSAQPAKPVPAPDPVSEGFWAAAARHVLAIQRCVHCGTFTHPPGVVCRACLSPEPGWRFEPVSGRARICTWTVLRQSFLPGFQADVPYVVVEGELIEQRGLRLVALLLDGVEAKLSLGAPLRVEFEDVGNGMSVPRYRLGRD